MRETGGLQQDLFGAQAKQWQGADRMAAWEPDLWEVAPDWQPLVQTFLQSPAGLGLGQFLTHRLTQGACIYPPQPLRALTLTPLAEVRVVIVGQDPYHGPGQAEGLAFSVAPGVTVPPSLRNIFKELARESDAAGIVHAPPVNGSLVRWAKQGVLLLNTCLTVEQGNPASHEKRGWEVLTESVLGAVASQQQPVVFMLWGGHAQKVAARSLLSQGRHVVLTANHPSPLSALRLPFPFIGCNHFKRANDALVGMGQNPIIW